jgi:hypothetical protein
VTDLHEQVPENDHGKPQMPTPAQRVEQCKKEIGEVLQRHGCDIVACLGTPEPVGEPVASLHRGILVRASVVVVPL